MKYIVTGGCGFIGSNYIRELAKDNDGGLIHTEIHNIDCLTYAGRKENLNDVSYQSCYTLHQVDIRDQQAVEELFRLHRPNIVVNFAAYSHVDRSIESAADFVHTNIVGTFNLLEAARKYPVLKFIQIGTDEVYGQIPEPKSSIETDPLEPRSPYSSSKASADLLALSYFTTHKVPVIVTRCCNNYGPHQLPEKLIPLFVTNLIEGKQVPVYGDGLQVREWIHVNDHNSAVQFVIEQGKVGEIYNIGTGDEKTNLFITNYILKHLGKDESSIKYVEDRKGHDRRYSLDSWKIRRLGWEPLISFEDGLKKTIGWYVENGSWWQPIKQELQEYYNKQYK